MLRKTILKLWQIYKVFCIIIMSIYFIGMPLMLITNYVEDMNIVGDIYVGRGSLFSGYYDVYLWTEDGRKIIDSPVEFLCFDGNYIHAILYEPRDYIYDIEKKIGYWDDEKSYAEILRKSNLYVPNGPCRHHGGHIIGATYFLQ